MFIVASAPAPLYLIWHLAFKGKCGSFINQFILDTAHSELKRDFFSATNLVQTIRENYSSNEALLLERKLLNAIIKMYTLNAIIKCSH